MNVRMSIARMERHKVTGDTVLTRQFPMPLSLHENENLGLAPKSASALRLATVDPSVGSRIRETV